MVQVHGLLRERFAKEHVEPLGNVLKASLREKLNELGSEVLNVVDELLVRPRVLRPGLAEHLSRVLKQLRQEGIIQWHNGWLVVPDVSRLRG